MRTSSVFWICLYSFLTNSHIAMSEKYYRLGRLRHLRAFVSDPVKLQELRGRNGDTLKAKLRQNVPGERTWYSFLHRARFDADEQRVLDELNLHGYMQTIWLHAETMTLLAQVMVVLLQP